MYRKLFVFIVMLYDVICQLPDSKSVKSYQLPDGDRSKSLNVTITSELHQPFQITIECYSYNSLKYFEIRLGESEQFELRNGLMLDFIKCFNNATDTDNYNYGLRRSFNSLPYFNSMYQSGYPITIKLDEYAEINSDLLFYDFHFQKFDDVTFTNTGFVSSKFLKQLYCQNCLFTNNGRIDFNEFGDSVTNTSRLEITFNKLINFNRDNLKKFSELSTLEMIDFVLDDYNALNVPILFEGNVNIAQITFERSNGKIVLHEQVFHGLKILHTITLKQLQLDFIPKDLFKDLDELYSVYLMENNIKAVDPTTFQTNKKLTFIIFDDNPFYTEPHDKLEGFRFVRESICLQLANFTTPTFELLEKLIKNPNVSLVTFQSFLVGKFDVNNFIKVNPRRNSSFLSIIFTISQPVLNLEHIKSFGSKIQSLDDVIDETDAVFDAQLSDDICQNCTMIKQLFPHFLNRYQNPQGYHLQEKNVFIQLDVRKSCKHFKHLFEEPFEVNCPANCVCKYNPLLDKIIIDCNNKHLTEIPRITLPTQFDKIHSIDLDFENNSISVLTTLINQDANVLKKLSTLNFKNNQIESINITRENFSINVWSLNLCGNPILSSDQNTLTIELAFVHQYFSKYSCNTDFSYPEIGEYIKEHKSSQLENYLNGLKCNKFV